MSVTHSESLLSELEPLELLLPDSEELLLLSREGPPEGAEPDFSAGKEAVKQLLARNWTREGLPAAFLIPCFVYNLALHGQLIYPLALLAGTGPGPSEDESPPRHLLFSSKGSFHPDGDQRRPHTAAALCVPTLMTSTTDKSTATRRQELCLSEAHHSFPGSGSTVKPQPLPFFAGFLLLFSCPLTSCKRFSSSFFFSWANSSLDFAACFFPLAAVEEERTISETAWLWVKKKERTSLFYRACTAVGPLCGDTKSDHTATTHPR